MQNLRVLALTILIHSGDQKQPDRVSTLFFSWTVNSLRGLSQHAVATYSLSDPYSGLFPIFFSNREKLVLVLLPFWVSQSLFMELLL